MSFAVSEPEIDLVMEMDSGEVSPVSRLLDRPFEEVMRERLLTQESLDTEAPRYRCPYCGVPVYLVALTALPRRFFFRHRLEDGRCSRLTRGELSRDEIDARKYNGAKESEAHRRMKAWLVESLSADARFSGIEIEQTWKGALTGAIRRPDVRACIDGMRVAFEVQLSTTYLSVIAGRRKFYAEEGGLLFWVFAKFDADSPRLAFEDVFYSNNQNAFVVDSKTVAASTAAGEFRLECLWAEPLKDGGVSPLHREQVSFHELSLDVVRQRAFLFDFEAARRELEGNKEVVCAALRRDFEAFWLAHEASRFAKDKALDARWCELAGRLRPLGYEAPKYRRLLPRVLLNGLYSLREGHSVGFGFRYLIEVVHRLAAGNGRPHLRVFARAIKVYGRAGQLRSEGSPEKWAAKVEEANALMNSGHPDYVQDRSHDRLVQLLFPELYGDAVSSGPE